MVFPREVEALSYRGPNFGNTYEDSYPVIVAGKGAEIPGTGGQKDADFVSENLWVCTRHSTCVERGIFLSCCKSV